MNQKGRGGEKLIHFDNEIPNIIHFRVVWGGCFSKTFHLGWKSVLIRGLVWFGFFVTAKFLKEKLLFLLVLF